MGNVCCGPNQNESCGWPPGTIRAILALPAIILTFIISAVVVILLIVNYQQYTIAVGLLGTMFSVISAIVGYYFGTKAGDTATEMVADTQRQIADAHRQIIDSKDAELSRMIQLPRQM